MKVFHINGHKFIDDKFVPAQVILQIRVEGHTTHFYSGKFYSDHGDKLKCRWSPRRDVCLLFSDKPGLFVVSANELNKEIQRRMGNAYGADVIYDEI